MALELAAHAKGLIHRDIKPSNVWLEELTSGPKASDRVGGIEAASSGAIQHRVKILDFGLARPLETEQGLTSTHAVMGTVGYFAPEQAQGGPVDERCDLFSLEVVLYRACSGQMPFAADNLLAYVSALGGTTPPRPRGNCGRTCRPG